MGAGLVGTLWDGIGLVRCHKRETYTFPVYLLWSAVTWLGCLPKLVTLVAFESTAKIRNLTTASKPQGSRYLGYSLGWQHYSMHSTS